MKLRAFAFTAFFGAITAIQPVAAKNNAAIYALLVLNTQDCDTGAGAAVGFIRHLEEKAVQRSGVLNLEELGYRVDFRKIPALREESAHVCLHDRSRGVDDNYLLFSRNGLAPFTAAYVITRLSETIADPEKLLQSQAARQVSQAGEGKASFIAAQTPLGPGMEMVVGGRVGSACFPTSAFQYASDAAQGSIGISRFTVRGPDFIEYALVMPWPQGIPQAEMISCAQAAMKEFEAGLEFTGAGQK